MFQIEMPSWRPRQILQVEQAPRSERKKGLSLKQLTLSARMELTLRSLRPESLVTRLYGFSGFLPITFLSLLGLVLTHCDNL